MTLSKALLILLLPTAAWAQAPAEPQDEAALRKAYDTAQKRLQDWPALARYRDANTKVAPPEAGENRVVFMGDSITDGWGRGHSKFFPGKPYINRGIGGQTTPQMLIRF